MSTDIAVGRCRSGHVVAIRGHDRGRDTMMYMIFLHGRRFVAAALSKADTVFAHGVSKPAYGVESTLTVSGLDVSQFTSPVPEGWIPVPPEFSVNLETSVEVLFEVIKYGARNAGEASTG